MHLTRIDEVFKRLIMTIKQFAFDTQQHLQAQTHIAFKRSHVPELVAAAFVQLASPVRRLRFHARQPHQPTSGQVWRIGRAPLPRTRLLRCRKRRSSLRRPSPVYLTDPDIGVIRIADLVAHLRYETNRVTDHELDELDGDAEDEEDTYGPWFDRESLATHLA